jgi:hypothetical protein
MRNIVLDESVISADPRVLFPAADKRDQVKLFLPSMVVNDLRLAAEKSDHARRLLELVNKAVKEGSVTIRGVVRKEHLGEGPLTPEVQAVEEEPWMPFHKREPREIISLALQLKVGDNVNETVVATQDGTLRWLCELSKVGAIDLKALQSEVGADRVDDATRQQIREFSKSKRRFLLLTLGLTPLVAGLVSVAVWNIGRFITNPYIAGVTIIAAAMLGFLFYWCRGWYRLQYGVAEFVFGIVTVGNVFFPNFDYRTLERGTVFQIVGGLYILVRGLDNFGKGLETTQTRLRTWWRNVFGKQ